MEFLQTQFYVILGYHSQMFPRLHVPLHFIIEYIYILIDVCSLEIQSTKLHCLLCINAHSLHFLDKTTDKWEADIKFKIC